MAGEYAICSAAPFGTLAPAAGPVKEMRMKLCKVCKGAGARLISVKPISYKRYTSCAGRGVKAAIGATGPALMQTGIKAG